jgi:hypothetical protein
MGVILVAILKRTVNCFSPSPGRGETNIPTPTLIDYKDMTMRLVLLLAFSSLAESFLQRKPSRTFARIGTSSIPPEQISESHDYRRIVSSWMSSRASAISSNMELLPGIEAIDAANDVLFEKLSRLRDNSYFRLYSVDILASCEYMPQELFECYSETCEIYPVDENEVRHKMTCSGAVRLDAPQQPLLVGS